MGLRIVYAHLIWGLRIMWAQSVPEQRVHLKDIEEKHYNTVIEDTTNALKHLPYAYALWISHRAMQEACEIHFIYSTSLSRNSCF